MRASTISIVALFAAALVVSAPACTAPVPEGPEDAGQGPYRILVTNDDGIGSPGIRALADALRDVGEVTVVAPCAQRSGSSMSVQLGREHRLNAVGEEGNPWGHCIDATPADAVLLAIEALAPEGGFDLVVSGINAGANTGDLARMSGTVGAAMMGAYYGVPAVAASLGGRQMEFGYAAEFTARFVERLRQRPPLPRVVLSINFPAATEDAITGVSVARPGGSYLGFRYDEVEPVDGVRVFRPRFESVETHPPGSDSEAFAAGMITIAPLRFDWTDEDALRELGTWALDHRLSPPPEN